MDFSLLKNLSKKQLQLYANKLVYSCDISMNALETPESLTFTGGGKFRLGPVSSNIKLASEFVKKGQELRFKNYKVEVERLGFYENYEMGDGVIYYSNSKGQEMEISINKEAFQDPLSFLFQMVNEGKGAVERVDVPLLIGKRVEKFSSKKISGILNILQKSKLLARIKEGADKIIIEIPKLKVKLELLFKNDQSS